MRQITTDRRTFLRRGAMGAGALWLTSLPELAARRRIERRRDHQSSFRHQGRPVAQRVVHTHRNRKQLRRWRHTVGDMDHLRGDERRRRRMVFRRRRGEGRSGAAR